MTVKEELHRLIEVLDEEDAVEALEYLRWLAEEKSDILTPDELARVQAGESEIARGEYVTLDELERRFKP